MRHTAGGQIDSSIALDRYPQAVSKSARREVRLRELATLERARFVRADTATGHGEIPCTLVASWG